MIIPKLNTWSDQLLFNKHIYPIKYWCIGFVDVWDVDSASDRQICLCYYENRQIFNDL